MQCPKCKDIYSNPEDQRVILEFSECIHCIFEHVPDDLFAKVAEEFNFTEWINEQT